MRRCITRVQAHGAEVRAEPRLHLFANARRERRSSAGILNRRCTVRCGGRRRLGVRAVCNAGPMCRRGYRRHGRRRHSHDMTRYRLGLDFRRISRRRHRKAACFGCLNGSGRCDGDCRGRRAPRCDRARDQRLSRTMAQTSLQRTRRRRRRWRRAAVHDRRSRASLDGCDRALSRALGRHESGAGATHLFFRALFGLVLGLRSFSTSTTSA